MKDNVIYIPPKKIVGNNVKKVDNKKKLRVAAYCRVSTDNEEQEESYKAQVDHYTLYIKSRSDWELAKVYADDGISGTSTRNRDGFNSMIADCKKGKIDLIITKSISRFSRNTLDCLKYVRLLKEKNIPIIFEKENINTMDSSGELLLTIMASLAQQESQSISQNTKMGFQFKFQKGEVMVNHKLFLGYTKDENHKLVIVEEEAKIVRRIYKEFLEGHSLRDIARGLEADNIKTVANNDKWHLSVVKGILTNEKYIGDALLQKTIKKSFMDKRSVKNDGSAPQYYITDDHEAIIPKDIFKEVQLELERRSNLHNGYDNSKQQFSGKYALCGICTCSKCNGTYLRTTWTYKEGPLKVWRCSTRHEKGPDFCDGASILERDLQKLIVDAINQLMSSSSSINSKLTKNMEKAIIDNSSEELAKINETIKMKQKEILELVRNKQDYESAVNELDILKETGKRLEKVVVTNGAYIRKINELKDYINNKEEALTEYDESMVRKYISGIVIYENKIKINFKAGVSVTVKR